MPMPGYACHTLGHLRLCQLSCTQSNGANDEMHLGCAQRHLSALGMPLERKRHRRGKGASNKFCRAWRTPEHGEVYATRQHVNHGEHRRADVCKGLLSGTVANVTSFA